jgi:hypothetical protein
MIKRLVWFSSGAVTGFAGAVYGYARLRRTAGRLRAERVADSVVATASSGAAGVRRFVDDTRRNIRDVEAELDRGQAAGSPPVPPSVPPRR